MIPFTCKIQNRQICRDRKWIRDCQGLGGGEDWKVTAKGHGFFLGGDKVF